MQRLMSELKILGINPVLIWLSAAVVFALLSVLLLLYLSPAFFLSTISVLFGVCFSQEHIPTLFCGMLWMLVLMAPSLVQLPGVEYFYLFICFVGDPNDVWIINKVILGVLSLLLWRIVYRICESLY